MLGRAHGRYADSAPHENRTTLNIGCKASQNSCVARPAACVVAATNSFHLRCQLLLHCPSPACRVGAQAVRHMLLAKIAVAQALALPTTLFDGARAGN